MVLFELELWPSFLRECNRAGVPIAVVNGRITERSVAIRVSSVIRTQDGNGDRTSRHDPSVPNRT